MIDPFERKFGKWSALHATIAASAEILAASSVMGALGSTLEVSNTRRNNKWKRADLGFLIQVSKFAFKSCDSL